MIFEGWVDEVENGIVWGRLMYEGAEVEFSTPLLSVPECQRVDLAPGSYITVVNGYIAVNKSVWTSHDMETADAQAREWSAAFAAKQQPLGEPFQQILTDNLPELYLRT